jgi:hypothetical protein
VGTLIRTSHRGGAPTSSPCSCGRNRTHSPADTLPAARGPPVAACSRVRAGSCTGHLRPPASAARRPERVVTRARTRAHTGLLRTRVKGFGARAPGAISDGAAAAGLTDLVVDVLGPVVGQRRDQPLFRDPQQILYTKQHTAHAGAFRRIPRNVQRFSEGAQPHPSGSARCNMRARTRAGSDWAPVRCAGLRSCRPSSDAPPYSGERRTVGGVSTRARPLRMEREGGSEADGAVGAHRILHRVEADEGRIVLQHSLLLLAIITAPSSGVRRACAGVGTAQAAPQSEGWHGIVIARAR